MIVPWGEAALDGTPCNVGTRDMCIAGICRVSFITRIFFFFYNFVPDIISYFSNCNRYCRKLAAIGRSTRTLRKIVAESVMAMGPNARPRAVFTTKMTGQDTRR